MNKITRFFKNIYKSLFDLGFYQELLKTPISFSLKYLYLLLYVTVLVSTLLFLPNLMQLKNEIPKFVKTVQKTGSNFYPQELVINIKNGVLSTNVKEPYILPLPQEIASKEEKPTIKNLVVIDTKANSEDIKKYSTAILVTNKTIVYPNKDNYEFFLLENIKQNVKIDKNVYESFINKIAGYLNQIPQLLPFAFVAIILIWPFIGAGFNFLGHLLVLVFYTIIPFLVAKLFKKTLSLGKTYQFGIHCSTLIIAANFIFGTLAEVSKLLQLTAINKTMIEVAAAFGKAEFWVFLIWICFVIYKIKAQPVKK